MGADVKSSRQGIDENLHAVLRAYRAGDGRDHGKQDRGMGEPPPSSEGSKKRKGANPVAKIPFHFRRNPPGGWPPPKKFNQTQNPPLRFHGNPRSRLDCKN